MFFTFKSNVLKLLFYTLKTVCLLYKKYILATGTFWFSLTILISKVLTSKSLWNQSNYALTFYFCAKAGKMRHMKKLCKCPNFGLIEIVRHKVNSFVS